MKIYLAHGHRNREDGKTLEHILTSWGHQVYNPFDGDKHAVKLTQAWEKAAEAGDTRKLLDLCNPIYKKDLNAIKAATALVAYYPTESTGTAQEIQIARRLNKKTIVLTSMIHPFIQGHVKHILTPFLSALEQLRMLLEE